MLDFLPGWILESPDNTWGKVPRYCCYCCWTGGEPNVLFVCVCELLGILIYWTTSHNLRHVPWRMEKAFLSAWLLFMELATFWLARVRALSQLPDGLHGCGGLAVAFQTWTCAVCAAYAVDSSLSKELLINDSLPCCVLGLSAKWEGSARGVVRLTKCVARA